MGLERCVGERLSTHSMQNAISSIARLNYYTAIRVVLSQRIASLPRFFRYRTCRRLAVLEACLMTPVAVLFGEPTLPA
jgi:hypothetical protein